HPTLVGKEQDIVVGGCKHQVLNHVLFLSGHTNNAFTATALGAVNTEGRALNVIAGRNRNYHLLVWYQLFFAEFTKFVCNYLSPALIGIALLHLQQLTLYYPQDFLFAR